MCGIIGLFNQPNAFTSLKTGLLSLGNRGRDGVGVSNGKEIQHKKTINELSFLEGKNFVGHTLHAIVDHIPQPLKDKGILVANCEIYNWQELAQRYSLKSKNDAELLLLFLDKFGISKIEELDGVFSFAYWKDNALILARDILGEKPLWYTNNSSSFSFASEKKVLEQLGHTNIQELNPRSILFYNVSNNTLEEQKRPFFTTTPEIEDNFDEIRRNVQVLLQKAIEKRIPQKKFGLLFSGGIDSTLLAYLLKKSGCDVTCYTAGLEMDKKVAEDVLWATKVAKELGLTLKIKTISLDEVSNYLTKIVPLIEDSNVVKVGVALPFYLACEMAKADGCKVIFSGLGSEEIFAGYERHKASSNINQECVSGLLKMYERDLYRDDVVTMYHGLELRLPYLDLELVRYALRISSQLKIKESTGKVILREMAYSIGVPQEFAQRKKTAAQYGSRFDYAIEKLAKKNKFSSKSGYLKQFYNQSNLKLGVLFSGGKDSTYAAYLMKKQNYELTCLIHLKSEKEDSYMFQTAGTEVVELQAEAMELPILVQKTKGEKEKELEDLYLALEKAKKIHGITGIVSGAVLSTYQRDRIEKIADQLGLKLFAPLWHKEPEQELNELLINQFTFILTAVAADGFDSSWLNKVITSKELVKLKQIQQKYKISLNGEGGEYESLVLDCPLFKKRIQLQEVKINEEDKNTAHIQILKARLEEK